MEQIQLNGRNYSLATHFKDDPKLRGSFNRLTRETYGFDFEDWYRFGYWKEQYLPYALLDGDTVVSNVSVNPMDFLILGKRKRAVQLGTVMTDRRYRGRGLCRALMERVLRDWEKKCDFIFLFANDSVLDFYPKFGFAKAEEYQCSKAVAGRAASPAARKLDMTREEARNLVYRTVSESACFSKVSALDHAPLVMFYGTSWLSDCVYYIDDFRAVAVAQRDGDTLFLNDLFCAGPIDVDDVIRSLMTAETRKVVLGFTPLNESSYETRPLREADTTLFIRSDQKTAVETNRLMFPVLSYT